MKTIDFTDILYRSVTLFGLDRTSIADKLFRMVRDFASQRLSAIWELDRWPDIVRISEEATTTTLSVVHVVIDSTKGDILNVYQKDPRVTGAAVPVRYYLYETGTESRIVLMDNLSTVWVEYRLPKPVLFGDAYNAASVYTSGSQIFYNTGSTNGSYQPTATALSAGNFYTANQTTTAGDTPTSAAAKWDIVSIPYFCGEFLVRGIFADYLRTGNLPQSAQAAEADAELAKMQAMDRVFRGEGQVRRMEVFTY